MQNSMILCVDDDAESLNALKTGLEQRGYAVTTASSGPDAIAQLKSVTPSLVITDLKMEPMNGFELYERVRKDPLLHDVPFFFLTAVDDFLARKYSSFLGVDVYITKPVDLEMLDRAIRSKLKLS